MKPAGILAENCDIRTFLFPPELSLCHPGSCRKYLLPKQCFGVPLLPEVTNKCCRVSMGENKHLEFLWPGFRVVE